MVVTNVWRSMCGVPWRPGCRLPGRAGAGGWWPRAGPSGCRVRSAGPARGPGGRPPGRWLAAAGPGPPWCPCRRRAGPGGRAPRPGRQCSRRRPRRSASRAGRAWPPARSRTGYPAPACAAIAATQRVRPVPSQRFLALWCQAHTPSCSRRVTSTSIRMVKPGPASAPRGHAPLRTDILSLARTISDRRIFDCSPCTGRSVERVQIDPFGVPRLASTAAAAAEVASHSRED
jgi:hypothetical protein